MPTKLGKFLAEQLELRQWSPEEFAGRNSLSVSHVYQIIRGDRERVRSDTLDRIAAGLGMAPEEMQAKLNGRALLPLNVSPEKQRLVELVLLVDDEDAATVERVVRPFAVQPTSPRGGKPKRQQLIDPNARRRWEVDGTAPRRALGLPLSLTVARSRRILTRRRPATRAA